jgi:hypothetical protein
MKHFYLPWIERGLWVMGIFVERIRIVFSFKTSRTLKASNALDGYAFDP